MLNYPSPFSLCSPLPPSATCQMYMDRAAGILTRAVTMHFEHAGVVKHAAWVGLQVRHYYIAPM